MPTYSLLEPFEFPYYFFRIRGELIKVLSIIVCIPSTFCPTLGHHQGRICYKSDVTFVLANYYCVRTSLLLEIMALAFKCNSVNSASFLTILLMNKLNVWSKMLTNKINSILLHPVNKHISNFFIVTKCTTIINPMKK